MSRTLVLELLLWIWIAAITPLYLWQFETLLPSILILFGIGG